MKTKLNNIAAIKVKFQYEDESLNLYEGTAVVNVQINYEVKSVEIQEIHAFNENDEQIEPEMSVSIVEQLQSIAALKALEKIEMVDFEKEQDND